MATGISTYLANAWLNALGNATSFSVGQCYIKLHIADPGANGTNSPSTETTRKAISFANSTTGSLVSDADITWSIIAGNQDSSHFSLWDNLTAGNFLGSGIINANAYFAGDTYIIPAGSMTLSLTVAS